MHLLHAPPPESRWAGARLYSRAGGSGYVYHIPFSLVRSGRGTARLQDSACRIAYLPSSGPHRAWVEAGSRTACGRGPASGSNLGWPSRCQGQSPRPAH